MTPRVRKYAEEAAELFGTTADRVLSPSRRAEDFVARVAIWQRLREDGFTLSQIGRWTGRDHSTVSTGLRRHTTVTAL